METSNPRLDVDFLCHHGTKGMHWYERRYQNPDGSLTEEGRKHWGVGPPRKDNSFRLETKEERAIRLEKKRQRKEAYAAKKAERAAIREQKKTEKAERKAEKEEQKRQEEAERVTKMKIDLINKGDKEAIYKNRDKFTDEELQYAMKRIELQNKFNTKAKGVPYTGPSEKEAREEQKALKRAEQENKKKIALINKGDMDEIYKNRAIFTDEELQYAKQRIALQNEFNKTGKVNDKKLRKTLNSDVNQLMKDEIAGRADPKEVYENRHLFSDDELASLTKRIENTQKIKGMDPEAKKAAEDLKKAQDNKKTAKDGKSTVEKINEGMKTAVAVGGTLVAAYQTYAKIAAAYNEMNPNGKQLPTVDLNPWSRKDSDKKDKDKDDDKKDNNNQGGGKKSKQNNQQGGQGNQNSSQQQKGKQSGGTYNMNFEDNKSYTVPGAYNVSSAYGKGKNDATSPYKTLSPIKNTPGYSIRTDEHPVSSTAFSFRDMPKTVSTSTDWKKLKTKETAPFMSMYETYESSGDTKLSDINWDAFSLLTSGNVHKN